MKSMLRHPGRDFRRDPGPRANGGLRYPWVPGLRPPSRTSPGMTEVSSVLLKLVSRRLHDQFQTPDAVMIGEIDHHERGREAPPGDGVAQVALRGKFISARRTRERIGRG